MEVAAAGAAIGEVTKCGIVHLEQECGYLFHFRRNVSRLQDMKVKLAAARNDVKNLIVAAEIRGDVIRQSALDWKRRAEAAEEDAAHLIAQAEPLTKEWFKGWCCSRFFIGRKAWKKNGDIQALLDERNAIGDTVADPKPFQSFELLSAGDFDAFASRKHTTDEVIEALKDGEIHLVGVFGMPGVGKTTLIKTLAKQVKKENLFDEVVVVVVSQFPNREKLQDDLASSLDLKLPEGDTLFTRAVRLSARLSQAKKVLIVLDDLWERLDLAELGIPLQNSDNGCKVVFTTRIKGVCAQMETNVNVEVPLLTENDSKDLFFKKADVMGCGISPIIATKIVDACGGLPLAIVTLGLALREKKSEDIWKATLTQLKNSIYGGMKPVDSSIRLSFNFLSNEATKLCFLLCSLFPKDYEIKIDVLLSYMWGENLFEDVETVRDARQRLLLLLEDLTSSNLLYKDDDENIMMHDVVRDVAIRIASKDDKLGFIVKAGLGLIRWPDVMWSVCKRMSVMENKIRINLSSQIDASHLLTLSMRDNSHLTNIPSGFFNGMGGLLTLDISYTGITSLPQSISCLVHLRTLLIEGCEMGNISPILKLEKLEMLSFRHSVLFEWPEDPCPCWRKLKWLDLSESRWEKIIPLNVIANMPLLEQLLMSKSMVKGELYIVKEDDLSELRSWTHMTSLELNVECCGANILFPNLENLITFRLLRVISRLCIYLEIPPNSVPTWGNALLAETYQLTLKGCEGMESIGEYDGKGFTELKVLEIEKCNSMKFLMDVNAVEMGPKEIVELEEGDKGQISGNKSSNSFSNFPPSPIFPNLKYLKLWECDEVEYIFPLRVCRGLLQLEELYVRGCRKVKIIFGCGSDISEGSSSAVQDRLIFPRLTRLTLQWLPELSNLSLPSLMIDCPSLENLEVRTCLHLKKLPFDTKSVPKLKRFEAAPQEWFDSLEWNDEGTKSLLHQTLTHTRDKMVGVEAERTILHLRRRQSRFIVNIPLFQTLFQPVDVEAERSILLWLV